MVLSVLPGLCSREADNCCTVWLMDSWWQLGESSGFPGHELDVWRITCAFCGEKGNFERAFHEHKQKPNSSKRLNFDVYKCKNCMGFVHVLWSAGEFSSGLRGLHAFKILPWAIGKVEPSENWPDDVQRYWTQAKESLKGESWDAAAIMARSALQVTMRDKGAEGKNLWGEIENLASKGILPPLMKDWSHEIRELGNDSAHPDPKAPPTDPQDARDIVEFLDLLLLYLYDFPKQISEYRKRHGEAKN